MSAFRIVQNTDYLILIVQNTVYILGNFSQVTREEDSIDVEDFTVYITTSSCSLTKSTPQALPPPLSDRSTTRANQTRSKRQFDDTEREILELKKGKHSYKPFSSQTTACRYRVRTYSILV